MKTLLVALFIFLATINVSYGAVSWSGNTCNITGAASVAQIQSCLTGASGIVAQGKTGAITVVLPADTESWTSGIGINMNDATYINVTSLTIQGAGTIPTGSTKGSNGSTVIDYGTSDIRLFDLNLPAGKKFRLSNIKISSSASSNAQGLIWLQGKSSPSNGGGFRFDHLTVLIEMGTPKKSMRIWWIVDETYGVIDHSYILSDVIDPVLIKPPGNQVWSKPIGIGTVDALFIEDNYFKYTLDNVGEIIDGGNGMKCVIRNNDIHNYQNSIHGIDTPSLMRGAMFVEVYNNTWTNDHDNKFLPNASLAGPLGGRSGTWVGFNNHIYSKVGGVEQSSTGLWSTGIFIRYHRAASDADTYTWGRIAPCNASETYKACYGPIDVVPASFPVDSKADTLCTTEEECGGTTGVTTYCQVMDLKSGSDGYPCRDQMGVTHANSTTSYLNAYQFDHYPSLFWNNTFKGTTPVTASCHNGCDIIIKENRDYCLSSDAGTTINGVVGGYRPSALASCGGHATTYTPYTYPHPLVSGLVDTESPTLSLMGPGGYQACSAPSDDYNIGGIAQDNVAVTGVKCCAAGVSCTSSTVYGDMDLTLVNTTGETWTKSETVACDTLNKTYYCRAKDGSDNYSANTAIVFSTEPDEDTEAPTLSTYAIGADGRTLTLTFSEPVQVGTGGSTGFVLTNGDAEAIALTHVPGETSDTLTYQTAVCVPSTDTFVNGLVYTQPGNGIEDLAENDLATVTKTVTNGSGMACNSTTSLFEHGVSAPSGTANFSGNAVNLGVKFKSTVAGTMTHCSFYKIAVDTGTHVCTVYRVFDGSVVGTVDFAGESASGWQDQAFASALNIAANEDYIVTVSHPTGNWTRTADFFATTYTNSNLTATTSGTDYAGRYVYNASMAYPTGSSNRNYWVDFTMSYSDPIVGPWQCTVSRTGDGCMVTGSQVVTNGGTCSATVTLRNGWKATWGGTCATGSETGGVYTSGTVTEDCTLTAACTEQNILP